MLRRSEESLEATKAADQMTGVVDDFLRDDAIPRELVEFAVCEAMRVFRRCGWTSRRVLVYCRRMINAQAARLGTGLPLDRQAWLDEQLTAWILRCHDGP